MTWLIWRQHRAETLALAIAVAVASCGLLLLGQPMHELFPSGPGQCALPALDQACRAGLTRLQQDYGYSTTMLILLNFAPFAIGGLLGAPLLARELESGTWQLAWTQAVPRARWLAAKIAALATVTVVLTAGLSAAIGWYRQPLNLLGGFDITGFDLIGVAPLAYALFAFALGVAAGTVLRRSLPGVAAALVVFVAVRVTIAGWVRPHFMSPVTHTEAVAPGGGDIVDGTGDIRDLIIDQGFIGADGRPITGLAAVILEGKAGEGGADPAIYLNAHAIQKWVVFQPIERFWTFQLIETAIFLSLAAILLTLVIWRVRRRTF